MIFMDGKNIPIVGAVELIPQSINPFSDLEAGVYANNVGKVILKDAIFPTLLPIADSWIYSVSPDMNDGANGVIRTQQPDIRSVLNFDLSSIVSCSQAILELDVQSFTGTPSILAFHLSTGPFVESEVSWNNRDVGNTWSSAGGDFGAQVSASAVNIVGTGKVQLDITTYVTDVLGSTPNRGIILRDVNVGNLVVYYSKEEAVVDRRPKLIVKP